MTLFYPVQVEDLTVKQILSNSADNDKTGEIDKNLQEKSPTSGQMVKNESPILKQVIHAKDYQSFLFKFEYKGQGLFG